MFTLEDALVSDESLGKDLPHVDPGFGHGFPDGGEVLADPLRVQRSPQRLAGGFLLVFEAAQLRDQRPRVGVAQPVEHLLELALAPHVQHLPKSSIDSLKHYSRPIETRDGRLIDNQQTEESRVIRQAGMVTSVIN